MSSSARAGRYRILISSAKVNFNYTSSTSLSLFSTTKQCIPYPAHRHGRFQRCTAFAEPRRARRLPAHCFLRLLIAGPLQQLDPRPRPAVPHRELDIQRLAGVPLDLVLPRRDSRPRPLHLPRPGNRGRRPMVQKVSGAEAPPGAPLPSLPAMHPQDGPPLSLDQELRFHDDVPALFAVPRLGKRVAVDAELLLVAAILRPVGES